MKLKRFVTNSLTRLEIARSLRTDAAVLLLGDSHLGAYRSMLRGKNDDRFLCLAFGSGRLLEDLRSSVSGDTIRIGLPHGDLVLRRRHLKRFSAIGLCVGFNTHRFYAPFDENPEAHVDPHSSQAAYSQFFESRLVEECARSQLAATLTLLQNLRAAFAGRIVLLPGPAPRSIWKNPGLVLHLHRARVTMLQSEANKIGISSLPYPSSSLDSGGFLDEEYAVKETPQGRDLVHANEKFAELLYPDLLNLLGEGDQRAALRKD